MLKRATFKRVEFVLQTRSTSGGGSNMPPHFANDGGGWKRYTFEELKASRGVYPLLISSVIPRPIALISTQSKSGSVNCAPHSYFNALCHDPPLVVVGMNLNVRNGTKKDTLNNVEETGQFVVNIVSSWYLEGANHCSGAFPPDQNEMELAGLTCLPSEVVKAPRVAEAAIQLECEVVNIQPHYNDEKVHTVSVVTGRIVRFHVHDSVLTDASRAHPEKNRPVVDWGKLKPVGRMGGDTYTIVDNGTDLARPVI